MATAHNIRHYDAHSFYKYEIKVIAPFDLPLENMSFDSGKTNGVMPADVMRKQRYILIRRFVAHLINPESCVIWKP